MLAGMEKASGNMAPADLGFPLSMYSAVIKQHLSHCVAYSLHNAMSCFTCDCACVFTLRASATCTLGSERSCFIDIHPACNCCRSAFTVLMFVCKHCALLLLPGKQRL